MQPYFLLYKCSSPEFLRMRDHTYKRRALDTTRKDDAGRNSIYQRLVNRLAHVPGGGQRCSEIGKAEGDGDGGRNGHRGRDVDDRKTKIRNSNLSREQLISRTSPHPLPLFPSSPRATSPAALAGGQRQSPFHPPRGGANHSCRRLYRASHVPSS